MESSALVSFSSGSAIHGGSLTGAPANSPTSPRRCHRIRLIFFPLPSSRQPLMFRPRRFLAVVPVAAAGSQGGPGRRAYKQSQAQQSTPHIPVKEIASAVAPAGVFLAITFVLWKVVEKILIPKPKGQPSRENQSTVSGMKWSFSPGTNLPTGNIFKIERDSKQKLNEFVKELRTFRSVDLSGRKFMKDIHSQDLCASITTFYYGRLEEL